MENIQWTVSNKKWSFTKANQLNILFYKKMMRHVNGNIKEH